MNYIRNKMMWIGESVNPLFYFLTGMFLSVELRRYSIMSHFVIMFILMWFPRAQEALKTGHFVSVLQVLMQLQRVCNHPELVAPRQTSSSFFCSSVQYNVPSLVLGALQNHSRKVNSLALYFSCYMFSLTVLFWWLIHDLLCLCVYCSRLLTCPYLIWSITRTV